MKKPAQFGFALVLIGLSIASFFYENEQVNNIIYASVVPSLLLTIVSFISDIMEKCQELSQSTSDRWEKLNTTAEELRRMLVDKIAADVKQEETHKRVIGICDRINSETEIYARTNISVEKIHRRLSYLLMFAYALFFMSIFLAPEIIKLFGRINVNCISLWSLTILFANIELKPELSVFAFGRIKKVIENKEKR